MDAICSRGVLRAQVGFHHVIPRSRVDSVSLASSWLLLPSLTPHARAPCARRRSTRLDLPTQSHPGTHTLRAAQIQT